MLSFSSLSSSASYRPPSAARRPAAASRTRAHAPACKSQPPSPPRASPTRTRAPRSAGALAPAPPVPVGARAGEEALCAGEGSRGHARARAESVTKLRRIAAGGRNEAGRLARGQAGRACDIINISEPPVPAPPSAPATPQRLKSHYLSLTQPGPVGASVTSAPLSPAHALFERPTTPSYPERSQRSPFHPRTVTRSGFVVTPERARPTLAMSMQIHAPSPVPSSSLRPLSPSPLPSRPRSHSRPRSTSRHASPPPPLPSQFSPQRPPMRPPSRSEQLLRNTLRRAEEHDRLTTPMPPLSPRFAPSQMPPSSPRRPPPSSPPTTRRHRRSTSASLDSCDCDAPLYAASTPAEDDDEDDPRALLYRTGAPPGSPSPRRPALARNRSLTNAPAARPAHSRRASQALPPAGDARTAHEAALRSRLEGVLREARRQERAKSIERRDSASSSTSASGSGSMASSRNMSGEGDFFFAGVDSSVSSYLAELKLSGAAGSPRMAALPSPPLSPPDSSSPQTPPDAALHAQHFDAHHAAALCRAMDGYVSFANVEGLGVPAGVEDDEREDGAEGRWWGWLKPVTTAVGRGRSTSAPGFAA